MLNKAMSDSIFEEDMTMPKAYIISSYRKISRPRENGDGLFGAFGFLT